jgi:hypothetical protein
MAVREDCRHYSTRSTAGGEVVQRCRVDAAEATPFACPEHCLFFEPRSIADAGWQRFERSEGSEDDPEP